MPCNIKFGENSKNVKVLQQFLRNKSLYHSAIDGKYGVFTRLAVKAYQRKHRRLRVDGWAGCVTTGVMKLNCAKHNCSKTPRKPVKPVKAAKPVKAPVVKPRSRVSSRILPDHTVSIGNIGFYAEAPELVEPFKRTIYDKVEIDNGPPRFYATNIRNREMNFKVTLIKKHPNERA